MRERVALIDDAVFDTHRAPRMHPECPERLQAARNGVRSARLEIVPIPARPARRVELAAAHSGDLLDRLETALEPRRFAELDADTYLSPGSFDAAWRAAGGAVELVQALMNGQARRGIALLRPPGHHAERNRAMGFCLLNNVAIAAYAALGAGAERLAIVDWDVHHGNGTQAIFEEDPRVMSISLHQWPLYPGTGAPDETGRGAGRGSQANFALPPGSGPAEYANAFRMGVLPTLDSFQPELILISAGYDAHRADPLASMLLDARAYAEMTSALVELAETHASGRIAAFLEGGYDLAALEESLEATAEALGGRNTPFRNAVCARSADASIRQTLAELERAS